MVDKFTTKTKKEITMDLSTTTFPKARLHPMMIIAGFALLLLCIVATVAVMGWIPT
jgi:hypothetical protein